MPQSVNGVLVPVVDCHCHLGGCITTEFVWSAIEQSKSYFLAESYDDVLAAMTFGNNEPRSFHRFLNKFAILDHLDWTADLIDESIKSVCSTLIRDGVDYTLIRASINKYLAQLGWGRKKTIEFIYDCFNRYAPGRVGLVLSLKYESERASQRRMAKLINDQDIANWLVGIDLVGDEAYYDQKFYKEILADWFLAGKKVFAHVGESQTAENVRTAIEIGIRDICHGVQIIYYPEILSLALDTATRFHLALSSNRLTGVVAGKHPVSTMIQRGLTVTVGTDDPVQCQTNIQNELELLRKELTGANIPDVESKIQQVMLNAAERCKDIM